MLSVNSTRNLIPKIQPSTENYIFKSASSNYNMNIGTLQRGKRQQKKIKKQKNDIKKQTDTDEDTCHGRKSNYKRIINQKLYTTPKKL